MPHDEVASAESIDRGDVIGHRREERFRQVVECAPNAMVIVNRRGEIEMVNVETERLFGYARRELLGEPVEMLVPLRHRGPHAGLRGAFLTEPRSRPMGEGRELHGLRRDGTEFPVEIGLNRIETADGPLVLSAIVDISARRQLETRLRLAMGALHQAEKMEALGRMTGGIAHDFNNALTVIIANLDVLATSDELNSPRVKRALDLAARGAARAAGLTAQLLSFSRHQTLAPSIVEPNRLVEGLSDMLAGTLGDAISLEVRLAERPWPIVADEFRLEDALLNLAVNARDAMPGGGTLTIQTGNVHLDADAVAHDDIEPGDFGFLSVADTGCGMTKEIRDRVFEPFFTTKTAGRGTGLGLAQVHGFVKQSQGCIRLETAPGSGSAFMLYFPRARGQLETCR